jgi:conjugative relaxase-like TrwC/TraI family protein
VLILAKITRTSAGGYAEYLEGKAQAPELGDYYLKDGERTEAPGRWVQGADQFGLDPEQPVTGEQLQALMDVRRPDTGEELRRVGGSGEAVAALDATFSAPKSVSAVWALGRPELRERIEQAQETAVDRALTYATRQVPMVRRRVGQDAVVHEKAVGVVATSWRHTTARAVADQVPDPQLRSHVLLHAAVRRDGRLVAIDSRSWLVRQREVGAAYRTELARELNRLGFQIQRGTGRGARYFELEGLPQGLLDRWSSRHQQVHAAIRQRLTDQERQLEAMVAAGGPAAAGAVTQLDLLRQTGQLSPAQERAMGTVTRSAKAAVTVTDLDTQWRRTALRLGVSRERIEVLRHDPQDDLRATAPAEVLEALTEFDAKFPAWDARAVALERSAGAPIAAALDQLRALRASDEILLLADGTGTTRDHRGCERTLVAITERLAAALIEPLPADVTPREIVRLDRELAQAGGRLSGEQRQVIELGCGEHPLVVIEGHAGTGKSTTLTGIARAHQTCGREILVTSTAALAGERLAGELADRGVDCTAYSTAGLHAAINSGRLALTSQTTVIHDEAALASTREQLLLLRAIETSGARLIAVGDPRQNQPVGAGGLWSAIARATRDAGAQVELSVNQRAHDPADRRDQARFREDQAELAVRGYAARDRIRLDPAQRRIEDLALDAAHADRTAGEATLVIAQTSNEHLDELNARAQAIRLQNGQLGQHGVELPGRPYQLHAGDLIQIRHTIRHPDHGQLRNGTGATVTKVDTRDGALDLRLTDGTEVRLDEQQLADADLRLAYVQHPFPAQGQTTDTAHLIIAAHATREGTYVALTRAREQTHLYASASPDISAEADRLGELAERISHTERDLASIQTPLAHEAEILNTVDQARTDDRVERHEPDISVDHETELSPRTNVRAAEPRPGAEPPLDRHLQDKNRDDEVDLSLRVPGPDLATSPDINEEIQEALARKWPHRADRDPLTPEHLAGRLERDQTLGWEP